MDEVLGPVRQVEEAGLVGEADVAGVRPAVAGEHGRRCLRVVPVADEDVVGPGPGSPRRRRGTRPRRRRRGPHHRRRRRGHVDRRRRGDPGPGRQRLRRLLERPGRDDGRAHRATAGCTPATSARRRRRLSRPRRPRRGPHHPSGFNVFPAEVEEMLGGHPAWPRPPWSASPTPARARRSRPSWCWTWPPPSTPPRTCGSTPTATWPATSARPRSTASSPSSLTVPAALGKLLRRTLRG